MVGPDGDSVFGSNPDLGLCGHQAQYTSCMLSGELRVNLLMSLFRILLALNIVNLILDTMRDWVNTVLITMNLQPNFFLLHNRYQRSPSYVIRKCAFCEKDTST